MVFSDPARLTGMEVRSRDSQKIGTVENVYSDSSTGRPEWAAVKTGWFGGHVSLVPLAAAEDRGDTIVVPYDKDFVKSAPHQDPASQLQEGEEAELFRYYGMPYGGQTVTATGDTEATTDDAMTRSEERLSVGKERVPAGRARLRKYVVTEEQTVTVPVTHEEARIEREPITEANVGAATQGPDISEAEHEVTLHAERPVVEKETVPVERVTLRKGQVPEEETVTEQVRKEQIQAEGALQEDQDPSRARRS